MKYSMAFRFCVVSVSLGTILLAGCVSPAPTPTPTPSPTTSPAEAQLRAEIQALQARYDALSANLTALKRDMDSAQAQFRDLTARYDDVNSKYRAIIDAAATLNEADIEKAIFARINQVRQSSGLPALTWTDSLYNMAREYSLRMATSKSFTYSTFPNWQEIFRAAGYASAAKVAEGALLVWKDNPQYQNVFLNPGAMTGGVGASKSGEVFYITYFADIKR